MNNSNTGKLVRRSTSIHGTDRSNGRSEGATNPSGKYRDDLMGERRRGSYDHWSEGGNRRQSVHAVPAEEERARDEAMREEVLRRRSSGETLAQLAKRFHSTKRRISQILAQQRWKQVEELELDYIPNEHFSHTTTAEERVILGPAPETRPPAKRVPRPTGLPPYLASMYETPLLTREQEQHLFRKMNYLKYKASELRDRLDVRRPSLTAMELIEKYC